MYLTKNQLNLNDYQLNNWSITYLHHVNPSVTKVGGGGGGGVLGFETEGLGFETSIIDIDAVGLSDHHVSSFKPLLVWRIAHSRNNKKIHSIRK